MMDLRDKVVRLKAKRDHVAAELAMAQSSHTDASGELMSSILARSLIQRVALYTQQQLRYRVTTLGTLALEAVCPDPIQLDLQFRESRGKTEARLLFERMDEDGGWHEVDPMDGDSGGMCSVAALGLRAAMREAQRPRTRPILIMDEVGNHLNDPTRAMHRKYAEIIGEISEKLGVQFLLVSTIPELVEIGEAIEL